MAATSDGSDGGRQLRSTEEPPVLVMRVPPQEACSDGYAQHVHQATLAAPLEPLREQDRLLPAANIFRIIQRELPQGAKISRDTKYFMQVGQLALNLRSPPCQIRSGLFCEKARGVAKDRADPLPAPL
jgi:hypothetical protein